MTSAEPHRRRALELDPGFSIAWGHLAVAGDEDDPGARIELARVLKQEHRLYPQTLRWLAEGRIRWDDEQLLFDDQPLTRPLQLEPEVEEQ